MSKDTKPYAMPPIVRFELEGAKQTMLLALAGYGEAWQEMAREAVEKFDVRAAIEAQLEPLIRDAIRKEVERQVMWKSRSIVEAAVGKHRLVQVLERIERGVLKDIQVRMAEEGIDR